MENIRKNTIYTFLIYIILLFIDGFARINMFLTLLPKNDRAIPVVINTFSLLISTGFIALTIIIISISTYLYLFLFDFHLETDVLLKSWQNLLLVDIFFEVIKISLLWILLSSELNSLNIRSADIFKEIAELPYTKTCVIIDKVTIFLSIIVFTITLYVSAIKQKVHTIILGIFLLLFILFLNYKVT